MTSSGPMHLFSVETLQRPWVETLFQRSSELAGGARPLPTKGPVALVFFEPSTRTRISFELASQALEAPVVLLNDTASSHAKGESLEDTLETLLALGVGVAVVRSPQVAWYQSLGTTLSSQMSLINAGDGTGEHPTQALLDVYTLAQHFGSLEGLKVGIFGDIKHSRVAHSTMRLLTRMGATCSLGGPPELISEADQSCALALDDLIQTQDALILLRVQRERIQGDSVSVEAYLNRYGVTPQRLAQAPEHLRLLHPGPVMWGQEISAELKMSKRSLITEQVRNGKWVRMALLEAAFRRET